MDLDSLILKAAQEGASDVHLESGLPAAFRIRGALKTQGEAVPGKTLLEMAREILPGDYWESFIQRRSADLSRNIQGTRCRVNVFHTSRGVGMAIRLLSSFQATVEKLNLHPDLKKLATATHGLILVSGSTGSGKSSTLAALIQEINLTENRHIITIESPIEYTFKPRRSYIRQREVGRDTPSFEQALIDSLREDPDVLMVGEMRDPETMRLTLGAGETGHLVLATVHSSTCAEALQRVVSAFPAEIQSGVAAQLADSLHAVIAQRLKFRPELNMRVPECEILVGSHAVRNFIRNREYFKIVSAIETGADHGMWSFQRYRSWLDARKTWSSPTKEDDAFETGAEPSGGAAAPPATLPATTTATAAKPSLFKPRPAASATEDGSGVKKIIEIDPEESSFGRILKRPGE
jgi:twitching motility protein PilT